jgi:hypothetical protein
VIIGSEFWKISIDNTNQSWDGFYCFRHEAIMEGKAKFHNGDFYILKCKYKNEEGTEWEAVENSEFIPSSFEFVPVAIPFKLF